MSRRASTPFSFPGSAWERTAREALPRLSARSAIASCPHFTIPRASEAEPRRQCVPRRSLGTRTRGFTLLEMVLALAIGLVLMISLYNVLNMQVHQAQSGRLTQQEATLARSILAKMTRDILANIGPNPTVPAASSASQAAAASGATTTATTDTSSTITLNNGVYGTNSLLILTVSKAPVIGDPTQQATTCDLRRVSYWMTSDGLAYQELMQATSNDLNTVPPDVSPDSYKILASEVKDVIFQYFDGVNWQDSWDGTTLGGPTGETPIGPPSAIKITLTLSRKAADNTDLPDDQLPKYPYVVAIPSGNNFPQTNP